MIEISKYTQIGKGSLVGRFNIRIQKWGGFVIREMTYFQKGHQRWVSFPSKQFEVEGEKKYMHYNLFEEPSMQAAFQEKVLKALDEFFKKNNESSQMNSQQNLENNYEEIPF